jgi:hypothetical protein
MPEILKVAIVVVLSSVVASAILTKLFLVFAHRVKPSSGAGNRSPEPETKIAAF